MGMFHGLACTSPSLTAYVLAPTSSSSSVVATVRSSIEWAPKKPWRSRKEPMSGGDHHHLLLQPNCIVVNSSDVWCALTLPSTTCPQFQHSRPNRLNTPRESQQGNMEATRKLFDSVDERNSVVWTALFGGYIKSGQHDKVLDLFRKAAREGDKLIFDMLILINVIVACSMQTNLEHGKLVHSYITMRN